jgi:hypothetical protein
MVRLREWDGLSVRRSAEKSSYCSLLAEQPILKPPACHNLSPSVFEKHADPTVLLCSVSVLPHENLGIHLFGLPLRPAPRARGTNELRSSYVHRSSPSSNCDQRCCDQDLSSSESLQLPQLCFEHQNLSMDRIVDPRALWGQMQFAGGLIGSRQDNGRTDEAYLSALTWN